MSITHVSDAKHDPKFVPPAAALQVVGLKVAQVRTDEALFDLISSNTGQIAMLDDQIAVAIYIFCQRGWTYEALIPKTGMSERSLKMKNVEGMAILRTKEVTRTTSAIRAGSLSKKVVDDITSTNDTAEVKVRKLEEAALASALSGYVTTEGKPAADSGVKVDVLHSKLTKVLEDQARPQTGWNLVNAIPALAEETGFKVKEAKRSGHNQGGSDNPLGLEANLKKALSDMRALETAAESPYVPTPQDMAALLELVNAISSRMDSTICLMLDADIESAIMALSEAGL